MWIGRVARYLILFVCMVSAGKYLSNCLTACSGVVLVLVCYSSAVLFGSLLARDFFPIHSTNTFHSHSVHESDVTFKTKLAAVCVGEQ